LKGIFITGTDTGVGKTWFGERLIQYLKQHRISVTPRKPVESGWLHDDVENTDAGRLAIAANQLEQLDLICPNHFKAAISPVRAAQLEGQALTIEQIKQQCLNINNTDFLHVEGAGGFYSPLASDGLNADLAQALGLPVILVAEDRLGCINQILLSLEAIKYRQLKVLCVFLNQINTNEDGAMNNQEDLAQLSDIPVYTSIEACGANLLSSEK
jgi:dethiobiotin synthetase